MFKRNVLWQSKEGEGVPSGGAGSTPPAPTSKPELKIGDKVYNEETIKTLETSVANAQKLSAFAQRYGLSPEAYANEAENAFGLVAQLIEQGVIDQTGVVKAPAAPAAPGAPVVPGVPTAPAKNDPVAQALTQLGEKISGIEKRFGELESGQVKLFQNAVVKRIKEAHPNLSDEDVDWVMRTAAREKNKPILDVAGERAKLRDAAKKELRKELEGELSKEYGIDFEKLNKVKGMRPGDVTAATVIGDRKLSFRGGEKAVSPGEALRAYLDAKAGVAGQ